ncbi:MAG: DEAD/DEAH box helicase family protein [Lachnospiraceae bacterium]|nr:DEAD/DEAH box helicase family protein [Lachnospiraceae bacterium]
MKREEISKLLPSLKQDNILLELPTSYGKTKLALEVCKKRKADKVLIVVPRLVLINNWKEEIEKWSSTINPTFVTYVSFPKLAGEWDFVIFDECHHLSERCRESLKYFTIKNSILLSATVKKDLKVEFQKLFKDLYICKVAVKEAIKENVLPEPRVYLIPLQLDTKKVNCTIIKNANKGNPITYEYKDKWRAMSIKNREVIIKCTEKQYYNDMTNLIEWHKRKIHLPMHKNLYLHKCGERLKWLSNKKTGFVQALLRYLSNYRTLTFCNSIVQTEVLGRYCINSKNADAREYLELFNMGKINHITACNMLDEGINLSSCKIGIYASLNSSERMITQKLGRLLRHPNPVIIIPYYKDTRDEEIVKKMCQDYNPELINVIKDIKDLKS